MLGISVYPKRRSRLLFRLPSRKFRKEPQKSESIWQSRGSRRPLRRLWIFASMVTERRVAY